MCRGEGRWKGLLLSGRECGESEPIRVGTAVRSLLPLPDSEAGATGERNVDI